MIKGIERVAPIPNSSCSGWRSLHAVRQDAPPKIISVDCELIVDTHETKQRLALLHINIRKYGTISNTVAEAARLDGTKAL
jgi:hypothetical protein